MFHHRHHRNEEIGSLELSEVQPDLHEPLQVADVMSYLRVTDDDDASLIGSYISAAREQAELMQHRHLVQKSLDLRLDRWPCEPVRLATPVVSVDLMQYSLNSGGDPVDVDASTYYVDRFRQPGVLVLAAGKQWPQVELAPSSGILIRFTVGYDPESPFWSAGRGPRIRAGMLLLMSHWYTNRLPYAVGASAIAEYPFAITSCFTGGVVPKVF